MLPISVDPSVADVLALGVVVLDIESVEARDGAALAARIRSASDDLRARVGEDESARAAFVAPARVLYKAFRIDPTKYRPSCEQLMRRLTRGDPFPRVNALVDALNLCQLAERLPYGIYDLDAIEPPVVARAGRAGEAYDGIRKGTISLEGRPALFDARGPFGNPTSDSDRAKTAGASRRVLAVVFGAPGMADEAWAGVLERTAATLLRHVRGTAREARVVRATSTSTSTSTSTR